LREQVEFQAHSRGYLGPFAAEPATSWAAPHLAGIAARILSLRPGLKPFEMKAILYWLFQARQRQGQWGSTPGGGPSRRRPASVGRPILLDLFPIHLSLPIRLVLRPPVEVRAPAPPGELAVGDRVQDAQQRCGADQGEVQWPQVA